MIRELLHKCGLSNKGAARLLKVKHATIKNWVYHSDRYNVPEGVIKDLTEYAKAAERIFNDIRD